MFVSSLFVSACLASPGDQLVSSPETPRHQALLTLMGAARLHQIHNSKIFGAILDEIILQSIKFGCQEKRYDFDAPIDIHELNGHVFGFFNALHLMHSERNH